MKNYDKIHLFLNRSSQGKRDANLTIKINTPFRALFEKELRRYSGSNSYVINTSLGIMVLCFVSCGCILFGISNIFHYGVKGKIAFLVIAVILSIILSQNIFNFPIKQIRNQVFLSKKAS